MKFKPWQNKGYHKQRNICNSDVNIVFWSLKNMMNPSREMNKETKNYQHNSGNCNVLQPIFKSLVKKTVH